jgi:hypothetical protein
MNLKHRITHNLINIPGWHTKRKIVVIESDDWGSIRMPSKEVYKKLLNEGYAGNQLSYEKYDSLASEGDLSALFEVLTSLKDQNGHHPIITANTVVANPDFEKIRASGFTRYYYEPFTETLKRYPNHVKSFELWKDGIEKHIFYPQFHAREHLNVARWMRDLQNNVPSTRLAFDHETISISSILEANNKNAYMDSFDFDTLEESKGLNDIVSDGLDLFEKIVGYQSKSFIASCYIWGKELERTLNKKGVKYLQGMIIQTVPTLKEGNTYKHNYHYLGQTNKWGQTYLLRNCYFEPSENQHYDWIGDCLNRIETAFRWGKPATISTHRLNFIGYIDAENRDRNLALFKNLLKKILQLYPDVEFMSSDQLGDLISSRK